MSVPNDTDEQRPDGSVYAVAADLVRIVDAALAEGRTDAALELVTPLHAADLADVIDQLPDDRRHELIDLLGPTLNPEVLTELDEAVLEDVIERLPPSYLARALAELDTDDAVWVLDWVDEAKRAEVLAEVPAPDRRAMLEGLSFPEDSAGRLMQREFIAVPAFWTVGQVIDYCRESDELPDEFYEIFVIDPRYRPVGRVPLNRILRTKRPVLVREIAEGETRPIPVDMDQEQVAYLFKQYRMASAPVVDGGGRMVGVITFDDVTEVVEEEAEEDLMRLGGVGETDLYAPLLRTSRRRSTWLAVNLGTAMIAAFVISLFGSSIEQMVALAILMPIVASLGGNAGTQTMTVAVRALATRELTAANALRIVRKEVLVGGLNGILFAVLLGLIAGLWFSDPGLGAVIALAMVTNLVTAGLFGMLVPLAVDRFKIDPAVAAPVFVTTITDVVGFFAFLGLATLVLL